MSTLLVGLMAAMGTGITTAPETPEVPEWALLDREIESLATSLQGDSGPRVGALLRLNYSNSGDIMVGGNDLGGFLWDNARVSVGGWLGDFEYLFQTEAASVGTLGAAAALDAWVRTALNEHIRLTLGLFPGAFLGSSSTEPQNLLFILRTTDAQFWNSRDQGVMVDGSVGALDWAVSVSNGSDGAGDDLLIGGRLAVGLIGGGVDAVQGAYGKGEDARATLALNLVEDQSALDDGDALAVEFATSMGPVYGSLEYLDYADDGGAGAGVFSVFSDTSPFSAVLSYMIVEDEYEAAIRYQDLDDTFDTQAITLGLNGYLEGHDLKWQINYIDKSADNPAGDAQTIALGLTVNV